MEQRSSNYGLFLDFAYTDNLIKNLNRDSEWKVLFILLKYMNWKTGTCYPNTRRIEQETGIAYRTVLDALKRLEEKGVIGKTKAKLGTDTPYYNSVYKILGWSKNKLKDTKHKLAESEVQKIIQDNLL